MLMKCHECGISLGPHNSTNLARICRPCNQKIIKSRKDTQKGWGIEYRSLKEPGLSYTDWLLQTGKAKRTAGRLLFCY